MAAAPVLNTETFPKSLLSFSCLSSRFLHFSSVINIGPFQSKSVKPLKNFLHYRYSTSQSLESNLSNSKHSLPGRGEEEAVNISFITILSYLIGNGYWHDQCWCLILILDILEFHNPVLLSLHSFSVVKFVKNDKCTVVYILYSIYICAAFIVNFLLIYS